jgi:hypothetical protein
MLKETVGCSEPVKVSRNAQSNPAMFDLAAAGACRFTVTIERTCT